MGINESAQKLANRVTIMPANYAEAMSDFFGRDVGNSIPVRNYRAKIGPDMVAKWRRNLENAFGL